MVNDDIFSAESGLLDRLHANGRKRYEICDRGLSTIGESDTIPGIISVLQRVYRAEHPVNVDNIPAITGDTYMICDAVTGNSITVSVDELAKLQLMFKILGK